MKGNMEERACALAAYIIENRATVRAAAKKFGVSKSTVHKDVTDRLSMLGIPAFVDLSGMEENDAGRLEWLKVYGLLLDCEDAANALYEQAAADLAHGFRLNLNRRV